MRTSSVLLSAVALVIAVSLLSIWFYPSVQDFMAGNTMWNGLRDFGNKFEAVNIESLEDLPEVPGGTALVAIAYLDYTEEELPRISSFVRNYGNTVLEYLDLNARFTGIPLLDPLFNHKNQYLPRITDFTPEVKESGVNVIMLNHATSLSDTDEQKIIAWSSSAGFLDINENGSWDEGELKGPFPVSAEMKVGRGKVILISDPSVIINTMVGRDDNYKFVEYLLKYGAERLSILVDSSHLDKTPLDVSKRRLIDTRDLFSNPYFLVGVTAMVFAIISAYALKKGEKVGYNGKSL